MPKINEPIGADLFNQTTTGTVSMTMSNRATDAHHIPCVIEPIVVRDEMTIKVDANGKVFALRGRDHKSVQCVVIEDEDVVRG